MRSPVSDLYEFGGCRLDVAQRRFTRDGQAVPLAAKSFELLWLLVQNPDRPFSKQELMTALWADTFVEEANLSFQISVLRKALGEDGARWIETMPKHGYRFTAGVKVIPSALSATVVTPPSSVFGSGDSQKLWFAAIAAALVLAATYLVLSRGLRTRTIAGPSSPAVPLTTYEGMQGAPSLSPDGSQVAFSWDGPTADNYDIWVKLVGPGAPLHLTTDPARDGAPAWSPDGRFIAFQRRTGRSGADVFIIPALGGAERWVAAVDVSPGDISGMFHSVLASLSWTPDSKWIAAGGGRSPDEVRGIWLISVDRPEIRRITEATGNAVGDWLPAISHDGRHMAVVRQTTRAASGVYVLPLSSAFAAAGAPVRVTPETALIRGLAWTPDDSALVFSWGNHVTPLTRLHRVPVGPKRFDGGDPPELLPFGEQAGQLSISRTGRLVYAKHFRDSSIWKVGVTEGPDRPGPTRLVPSIFDEHTPDYSPDGTRLAFTSTRSGVEEIWVSNADGSNPAQLTSMGGPLCANPRWAPDGKTILFMSRRDGSGDLHTIRPDGGELQRITEHPAEEGEPRWSRDGLSIYFASNRTGRHEVWRMPATGGAAVQVTQQGGMTATESPDGRFVYYAKQGSPSASIWRVPVGGGEERPIVEGLSNSLNFVVAQRGLYFLSVGDAPQKTSIELYDYATGKRTMLLRVGKPHWLGMALSPDQQSLLYTVIDSAGSNLMLVDKFR